MTRLSVNVNKIALLRNSRGRNYPSVEHFAGRCLDHGAHGITLHPRPDQRHARYADIPVLKALCDQRGAELNVEGFPSPEFLAAVLAARPTQCTLVPDAPGQLTSDHGWKIHEARDLLRRVIGELRACEIRTSLFVDYDDPELERAKEVGADRIELFTEPYAAAFATSRQTAVLEGFCDAARRAQRVGLGVNAGHDLNLENLATFMRVPEILEVSIGHALVVEAIDLGLSAVLRRYLDLTWIVAGPKPCSFDPWQTKP